MKVEHSRSDVFRLSDGREYAIFTVSVIDKNTYTLSIETSFGGGYAYTWSSPGRSFYVFLATMDVGYACTKMVRDSDVFDGEATMKSVRRLILEMRKSGEYDRDTAREEWNLAKRLDEAVSPEYWMSVTGITEPWFFFETCPTQRTREFCAMYEKFWPTFSNTMMEFNQSRSEVKVA